MATLRTFVLAHDEARTGCARYALEAPDDSVVTFKEALTMMEDKQLPPADAGRLETPVRPLRWLCNTCGWNGADAELLRASNPFDAADTVVGCPKCLAVNDVETACDEPGCDMPATCGFPALGGYRRTCGKHMQWWESD